MKKTFSTAMRLSCTLFVACSVQAFYPALAENSKNPGGPGEDSTIVVPLYPGSLIHPKPPVPDTLRPKPPVPDSLHHPKPHVPDTLHPKPPVPDTLRPKPPVPDSLHHPKPPVPDTLRPKPPVPDTLKHPKPPVPDTLRPKPPVPDSLHHPKPPVHDTLHPKPPVPDSLGLRGKLKVSIAPLPVSMGEGILKISGTKPGEAVTILIFTSQGTLVSKEEIRHKEFSLADFKAGYYLYKITDESGHLVSGNFFIQ